MSAFEDLGAIIENPRNVDYGHLNSLKGNMQKWNE